MPGPANAWQIFFLKLFVWVLLVHTYFLYKLANAQTEGDRKRCSYFFNNRFEMAWILYFFKRRRFYNRKIELLFHIFFNSQKVGATSRYDHAFDDVLISFFVCFFDAFYLS